MRWDFTFAFLLAKSWRALTRVFLKRRDLITIDELVIFFDPSILLPNIEAILRREGNRATLFYRVRRKSLFSLFFFSLLESRSVHHILRTSKATRPDASRTRQCILLLRLPPHFLYTLSFPSYPILLFCFIVSSTLKTGRVLGKYSILSGRIYMCLLYDMIYCNNFLYKWKYFSRREDIYI